MRKPHNLVTYYWDDSKYFLAKAEIDHADLSFPIKDKRGIRYCILASFLFLEAFINAEYVDQMKFGNELNNLSDLQQKNLDDVIINTNFIDKWSLWINYIIGEKQNLKGGREYQDLNKLRGWRNQLTHYKIHKFMEVAHNLETIENAREANRIVGQTIKWYYQITNLKPADWIQNEILNSN